MCILDGLIIIATNGNVGGHTKTTIKVLDLFWIRKTWVLRNEAIQCDNKHLEVFLTTWTTMGRKKSRLNVAHSGIAENSIRFFFCVYCHSNGMWRVEIVWPTQ